jgi:hypothetical protein
MRIQLTATGVALTLAVPALAVRPEDLLVVCSSCDAVIRYTKMPEYFQACGPINSTEPPPPCGDRLNDIMWWYYQCALNFCGTHDECLSSAKGTGGWKSSPYPYKPCLDALRAILLDFGEFHNFFFALRIKPYRMPITTALYSLVRPIWLSPKLLVYTGYAPPSFVGPINITRSLQEFIIIIIRLLSLLAHTGFCLVYVQEKPSRE